MNKKKNNDIHNSTHKIKIEQQTTHKNGDEPMFRNNRQFLVHCIQILQQYVNMKYNLFYHTFIILLSPSCSSGPTDTVNKGHDFSRCIFSRTTTRVKLFSVPVANCMIFWNFCIIAALSTLSSFIQLS